MWGRQLTDDSGRFATRPDHVLVRWNREDCFTLGDAWEGTFITGATGSSKTTGSGEHVATGFLAAGMGGLVLTAKSSERATWERYCHAQGRTDHLRVVRPGGPFRFNFLDYELQRPGVGAGLTENIVHLFAELMQISQRGAAGGQDNEGYWRRSTFQFIRNTVDLCVMAKGRISVSDLYRIAVSAPSSRAESKSEEWRKHSFCFDALREADVRPKNENQEHDFALVADYFLIEWPALADKTRSIILSMFTSMIDVIHRGVLRELFCTDTTLTPRATEAGAVIVIDLPVKEFGQVGQIGQVLWKTSFQRSIERRDVRQSPRSVFLWADEAQFFVASPYDMQFQTTARSARVATVLLTQNLGTLYAAFGGGDAGKAEAESLLGNLNQKVFHSNGDMVTNEWAAALIGKSRQYLANSSSQHQPAAGWPNWLNWGQVPATSAGISEHIDYEVQPRRFTTLRRGGPACNFEADAIVIQAGRRFKKTGRTWLQVTFRQNVGQ